MCKAFKMAIISEPELEKSLICILQDIGHESEIIDSKLLYNPEWPFILIPEFNFEFLGGDKTTEAYMEVQNHRLTIREIYWWSKWDSEVRIKAFDKLIGIYIKLNHRPYNMSLKNILEKFCKEPLDGFFILCMERGDVIMCPFGRCLSGRA